MKYFNKRAVIKPIEGMFDRSRNYRRAVVIPSLAERVHLPLTIKSLSNSMPRDILDDTLVLVVVNNRPPESTDSANQTELMEQIYDNAQTLRWLEDMSAKGALPLAWIDTSSPGNELPPRGGVGLARKIGCDSVLAFLLELSKPDALDDFVFFSLDADAIVSPDYLETAGRELMKSGCTGGVISFKHQEADSPESQAAIDEYEAFLNYYVKGLRWAGSPYAFHTIGSCLCFTASGYIRAGGFSARRQAGKTSTSAWNSPKRALSAKYKRPWSSLPRAFPGACRSARVSAWRKQPWMAGSLLYRMIFGCLSVYGNSLQRYPPILMKGLREYSPNLRITRPGNFWKVADFRTSGDVSGDNIKPKTQCLPPSTAGSMDLSRLSISTGSQKKNGPGGP